ncbi:hypothetical protein, partial [Burkholderia sp. SIMBA_051]|uniref:hypothetical protein n=1 Tax=Burkholderia sp. SIMBA_051 TaxID=3085792 RepID=UPI003978935F
MQSSKRTGRLDPSALRAFHNFSNDLRFICSDKYFGGTCAAYRSGPARSGKIPLIVHPIQINRLIDEQCTPISREF